ncbi:hypothetical protein QQZ08_000480 [Neonectria magnoliae]|uniref:Uncharacterized protein n=1 Tax=Neonectria magnoliae TaxID=2732573 RepID=A0ABR1IJF1_9HYPO
MTGQQRAEIETNLYDNMNLGLEYMQKVFSEEHSDEAPSPEKFKVTIPVSGFPKVIGNNIPPSDDEKEEVLENAREHVLHSDNVSMQITWARDALIWAHVAETARERGLDSRGNQTSDVESRVRGDALSIVAYIAEQGHPEALYMEAKILVLGQFDTRWTKPWLPLNTVSQRRTDSPVSNSAWADYVNRLGDWSQALEHYEKVLNLGDAAASRRLGMMYLCGNHDQERDLERGFALPRQSTDTADEYSPLGPYAYGMAIARECRDLDLPEVLLPG